MRTKVLDKVEKCRLSAIRLGQLATTRKDGNNGVFLIPYRPNGRAVEAFLYTMVSEGNERIPWEHVSVSVRNQKRCPTWEEMCFVKDLFWDDEECVVQYHPPKSEYISFHPYCLHLYRPLLELMPRPPKSSVGPDEEYDRRKHIPGAVTDEEFEKLLSLVKEEREI